MYTEIIHFIVPHRGVGGVNFQIEESFVRSGCRDYETHKGSNLFKTLHKNEQITIKKFYHYY